MVRRSRALQLLAGGVACGDRAVIPGIRPGVPPAESGGV